MRISELVILNIAQPTNALLAALGTVRYHVPRILSALVLLGPQRTLHRVFVYARFGFWSSTWIMNNHFKNCLNYENLGTSLKIYVNKVHDICKKINLICAWFVYIFLSSYLHNLFKSLKVFKVTTSANSNFKFISLWHSL